MLPNFAILAATDISTASLVDQASAGLRAIVPNLGSALLTLIFGLILIRVLSWVAEALIGLVRLPKGLKGILSSLVDALLWIFLVITVLQKLGLGTVAAVFSGSLATAGLALGLGGATLASDILAGIFLAKDRDFNLGDEVIAGENKTQGVIDAMDMRRTRIKAEDGRYHIIPNSVIERKEWVLVSKKKDLEAKIQNLKPQ